MEIGLCTNPPGAASIPAFPFDFLEVGVQSYLVPASPEEAFLANLSLPSPAPTFAANLFLPASLPCTGPSAKVEPILEWSEIAFSRAAQAGVRIIVFGSGGARNLPNGFPKPTAVAQMIDLLKSLGPIAQQHEVTVVIEPLNTTECNFINSLADGANLVECCDHPSIGLLADIFHMLRDGEPPEAIEDHGALLKHVHIAEGKDRGYPGKHGEDHRPYLQALRKVDYPGKISIESNWEDLVTEAPLGAANLRAQLADSGF